MQNLSQAAILKRGWTMGLITKFLGDPDETAVNPHYKSGPPIKLFSEARVEEAESSDEFQKAYARLEAKRSTRKAAYKIGIETRLQNVLNKIELLDDWSKAEIREAATEEWLDFKYSRGRVPDLPTDAAFFARISVNFVRHRLSNYDSVCAGVPFGIRFAVKDRIHRMIAEAYPFLADEARRQRPSVEREGAS